MLKKIVKVILWVLLVGFLLIQFYPKKNNNVGTIGGGNDIAMVHHVPDTVSQILRTSCYDCHSNHTVYPWYANVQPVSMWLADHIEEGKKEVNFSEFAQYSLRRQYRKLDEIRKQLETDEMPLGSYLVIHRNATLSQQQKKAVINWTMALRDSFKNVYPKDSLEKKK